MSTRPSFLVSTAGPLHIPKKTRMLELVVPPYLNKRKSERNICVIYFSGQTLNHHHIIWMFNVSRKYLKVIVFQYLAFINASFLAEISRRSPRKLIIFIIWKIFFLDESIQKNISFNFENRSTGGHTVNHWKAYLTYLTNTIWYARMAFVFVH